MKNVLITGADGHLGRSIVEWLLEHSDCSIKLWVRANSAGAQQSKARNMEPFLATGRCTLASGELEQDKPFDDIDPVSIQHVIHSAADTNFGITLERAQQVNVGGTRKLLDWASRSDSLQGFMLLSSIYSSGLREGLVEEEPLQEAEAFANHYEWSKWAAEQLLIEEFSGLPWQILRVGTVLADDTWGHVTQYNVVHNTLRLVFYGLLSVVPGTPSTRLYLTTTDFVAAACGNLLQSGARQVVYHVSDSGDQAIRLGAMLDVVHESFLEDERFRHMGILKPLFCDWESFSSLAEDASQFSGILGQSMSSIAPFSRQLFVDKDIHADRLQASFPSLETPDTSEILPRLCRELITTRWGLKDAEKQVA